MKVVFLIDSLLSGGAQRQIVLLALLSESEGMDVTIVTYHPGDQLGYQIEGTGIKRVHIPKKYKIDVVFFLSLVSFFRNESPDVVVSYLNTPSLWARLAKVPGKVKALITSERNTDIDRSFLRVFLENRLGFLSDYVVTNSFAIKEKLVAKTNLDPKKIEVIYNGVDTQLFSRVSEEEVANERERLGISKDEFVICLPGRITPQKNHMCLIEALDDEVFSSRSLRVLFVGNEIDKVLVGQINERIREKGHQDYYLFCGEYSNMPLMYSLSDLVVLPSLWEGFPNVVIEGMACECLVVASDISDNSLLIENSKSGYLFDSGNHLHLKDRILSILSMQEESRGVMGTYARDKIESLCSTNYFATKNFQLFRYLCDRQVT